MKIATLLINAALVGCASCPAGQDHVAELDEAEVISLATSALAERGYDLQKFHPAQAKFEAAENNCVWGVHFYNRNEVIGGDATVIVFDRTKRVDVHGGL